MKIQSLFVAAFIGLATVLAGQGAVAQAKPDAMTFNPATDGGRYISIHDSQTLQQLRFNLGTYLHYEYEPIELTAVPAGTRIPVVDDLIMANVMGAIGLTDWWELGVNLPVIGYETFYDPSVAAPPGPKRTPAGLGDLRIETKFSLLDIERYNFGIAVVPYVILPTGRKDFYISNEQFSPGGKLVLEGNISDRVWLGFNAGYQMYKFRTYYAGTNGYHDDTVNLGFGANIKLNPSWALIGETYVEAIRRNLFADKRQTPAEAVGAVRYMPLNVPPSIQGLTFTAGAGGGLTKGVGASAFKAFVGVNYRKPKLVDLPPPPIEEASEVILEEHIIITQKIHFEFDRDVIRPISYPILDDVVQLLKQNPQIRRVEVAGHTDSVGSDVYNQKLSDRRSIAVANYLVKYGIDRDRLIPVGYGESKPVADNETAEGRAKNRRTEFRVMDN